MKRIAGCYALDDLKRSVNKALPCSAQSGLRELRGAFGSRSCLLSHQGPDTKALAYGRRLIHLARLHITWRQVAQRGRYLSGVAVGNQPRIES